MALIDKKYHSILKECLKKGFRYEDPNRKGVHRIQIPYYTFKWDFKDGFPAVTTKKLYWKGIVGELLWFLDGDTNIKYLVDNNIHIWDKDAYNFFKKAQEYCDIEDLSMSEFIKKVGKYTTYSDYPEIGDLGRVYSAQWRDWSKLRKVHQNNTWIEGREENLDQISNLITGLQKNPMGTKHIVTAWNPAELNDMALPPCHWSFEILVEPFSLKEQQKYAKKHLAEFISGEEVGLPQYQFTLKWHQRSVDTFLGLPFNIASYALLAHIIGKLTNMVPKGLIGDLSNVHIYEPHLDAVNTQLKRSVNMFNSQCELLIKDRPEYHKIQKHGLSSCSFDNLMSNLKINDFNLTEHTEQPAIKAEMIPYS